jgi:hypothetical protein
MLQQLGPTVAAAALALGKPVQLRPVLMNSETLLADAMPPVSQPQALFETNLSGPSMTSLCCYCCRSGCTSDTFFTKQDTAWVTKQQAPTQHNT